MTPRPPLDELLSLLGATLAAEGITTDDGAAAGNSFKDAGLAGVGDNSFVSMLAILYPSQPRLVDSKSITAFDNDTGEVTLAGAYKGVAAAIPAGVPYKIVTFRVTPVEVAAIEAKLDHPDHGLAALKAILDSLAGGTALYGSYGPRNVEVGNDVDFGIILYDPSGNVITTGEIEPGTYTVHRIRDATDTEVVGSTALEEAAGRVYMTYNFPVANWAVGDIFYIIFSSITVTREGVTTEYPDLYIWGRVVREAAIQTLVGTNVDAAGTTTLFAWLAKLFAQAGPGLVYYGKVTTYTDTTHFKVSGLAGFGDDYFKDFSVYVVRDAAGAGAAPQGEMQPISDYVSSDGTFTHTAFTAPLAVDDEVLILHPRLAEIADMLADVGDASTSTLGSLYAILGNPAQTFLAMIGYEGATALANKLTAARATLLDEITAGRMSELDAGNIPADIDTLLTRLSLVRAGYLDNLSAGAVALEATLTAIKGGGWTTETLVAIKAAIDAIPTTAERGTDNALLAADYTAPDNAGIATLLTRITAAVALASALTTHDTDIKALLATIAGYIDTEVGAIETKLDTPANFMADVSALALEATLTAIKGADFATGTDSLKILSDVLDAIKAKTDNLKDSWNDITAAAVKTAIEAAGSHLALIKAQTDKITGKMLFPKDFWSAAQATAQITATPGIVALPSVIPSLPNGVTITRAIAMMKFRKVSNGDAAANYIDTTTGGPHDPALQVDKGAAGYIDALLLPDTFLRVEGDGIEGGDLWVGDTDIKAKVESGVATTFQLGDDLRCLATTLDLYDIQVGLRIWYSV